MLSLNLCSVESVMQIVPKLSYSVEYLQTNMRNMRIRQHGRRGREPLLPSNRFFGGKIPWSPTLRTLFIFIAVGLDISDIYCLLSDNVFAIDPAFVKVK
jgi:hypothetical protein